MLQTLFTSYKFELKCKQRSDCTRHNSLNGIMYLNMSVQRLTSVCLCMVTAAAASAGLIGFHTRSTRQRAAARRTLQLRSLLQQIDSVSTTLQWLDSRNWASPILLEILLCLRLRELQEYELSRRRTHVLANFDCCFALNMQSYNKMRSHWNSLKTSWLATHSRNKPYRI